MKYNRCGRSGLLMPAISLGLWHNFGAHDDLIKARNIVLQAWEQGITQFDLANNYGPPGGAAEMNFGRILREDLSTHRNGMIITSKAGHAMWDGPYGDWCSRKHLIASCDESISRLGVRYVDIFYSHRYDPNTPLEETMGALDAIVRSGRALYVGLSKYPPEQLMAAYAILRDLGTPVVVNQLKYSMLVREPEKQLFDTNRALGLGCVSFSPLAQGQLTAKYLGGIPENSRAANPNGFLRIPEVEKNLDMVRSLKLVADERGESLSQMALAWQLQSGHITSVIVGVSSTEQLHQNLTTLESAPFSEEQLSKIDFLTKVR
ncbi:MAG: aldo/keto reductase [Mucinivorans sp.]